MKMTKLRISGITVILIILLSTVFVMTAFAQSAEEEAPAAKALKESAAVVDEYLCIAEKSTGFTYNSTASEWETASFNVNNNKYIVSRSDKTDFIKSEWDVKRIGLNYATFYCPSDFDTFGYLNCELMGTFTMNRNNLRYLLVFPFGYVSDNIKDAEGAVLIDEGESRPFIEIGKCNPF